MRPIIAVGGIVEGHRAGRRGKDEPPSSEPANPDRRQWGILQYYRSGGDSSADPQNNDGCVDDPDRRSAAERITDAVADRAPQPDSHEP
jgi:hypothetical protein